MLKAKNQPLTIYMKTNAHCLITIHFTLILWFFVLFADEQLIMVLTDLFLTGFIPTASSLEFLVMFMVLNPKIQQKCQDEIDSVIGKNHRYPSINDTEKYGTSILFLSYFTIVHPVTEDFQCLSSLPYVQAVCIEVLRKVSFIPLTTRAATRDTYINGHFVPKVCIWVPLSK